MLTTQQKVIRNSRLGNSFIKVGASSWTDRSLTHESNWYPKRSMKAAERIAYYTERFPMVEMETTYRFPPTLDVTQSWVNRTPDGFTFDVQAWSLLTGQPTMPASLWDDLASEVRPDRRDRPKLYASHLSSDALIESWKRFNHSLWPLVENGRLGTIVLKFPRWLTPKDETFKQLAFMREMLGDLPACVEFLNCDWVESSICETTFSVLEELGFGFVSVDAHKLDARGLNGVRATTSDVAIIRLLGRKEIEEDEWRADWRGYRYSEEETLELVSQLEFMAHGARELHVISSTCWRDDAVVNAESIQNALGLQIV